MHIAMIDPSLFTLPYDGRLIAGLARIGHDVTLHGRALRPEDGSAAGITLRRDFYRVAGTRLATALPGPLRLAVKGLDHAWSMRRLLHRLQREPRPDVIHFQWLPLPMLDGPLLRRFRRIAPLVLTVHDTNPFNGDPSAALQSRGFLECLSQFDRLVVHTAQGAARLRRMGIADSQIAILPHGMLADPVPAPPDPMDGPLSFVLFGKIQPYKGADVLINAFAALPGELRRQARVRIVGKPYMDLAPLRELAARRGVEVEIEPGFVADDAVGGLFGPGAVAVFPYREIEASGVMFLALAHGRPVIASRLGSFAELLTDGVHGHLTNPGDCGALSTAMAHMIADRSFAAGSAAAVRELANAVPGWDEIGRLTATAYRTARGVVARPEAAGFAGLPARG